jgi:hypothetical protein
MRKCCYWLFRVVAYNDVVVPLGTQEEETTYESVKPWPHKVLRTLCSLYEQKNISFYWQCEWPHRALRTLCSLYEQQNISFYWQCEWPHRALRTLCSLYEQKNITFYTYWQCDWPHRVLYIAWVPYVALCETAFAVRSGTVLLYVYVQYGVYSVEWLRVSVNNFIYLIIAAPDTHISRSGNVQSEQKCTACTCAISCTSQNMAINSVRAEFNTNLWFAVGNRGTGGLSAGKINFCYPCLQESCITIQYRKLGLLPVWIHRCYKILLYFIFTQMHLTAVLK